jgi:hypothetical protein
MVMDAEGAVGTTLDLTNKASKGKSGRTVPLADELRVALVALNDKRNSDARDRIVHSERDLGMSPGAVQVWFHRLYDSLGFAGASSHSSRRRCVTCRACEACLAGDDAALHPGRQRRQAKCSEPATAIWRGAFGRLSAKGFIEFIEEFLNLGKIGGFTDYARPSRRRHLGLCACNPCPFRGFPLRLFPQNGETQCHCGRSRYATLMDTEIETSATVRSPHGTTPSPGQEKTSQAISRGTAIT